MRAAALLAAVVLALPSAASAQDEDAPRSARAAFQKGQTEYNLGNYAEAARQFEETYRLKPVPALLFNIAQCYRFMGNLDKAVQTYRAYLRNAAAGDKNVALATELLQQVEAALASKQKAERSAPHGLAPGAPADVPPAPRTAVPAVSAAPTPPRPVPSQILSSAPPEPRQPRVYTWVAAGTAAAALAGGAYFGHKSSSTLSDLQSGFHTRADIDSQSAAARGDAGKATVMLGVGAALAVAAGVLFALHF
jgi:tetratricopeptide (TPR) repeat protein